MSRCNKKREHNFTWISWKLTGENVKGRTVDTMKQIENPTNRVQMRY